MREFPERDWSLFKSLHRTALERFSGRVLDECAAIARADDVSAHDRYLRIFRLLKKRDDDIHAAFDDLRRSTAIQRLAAMINLGVITADELGPFSPATRESATALADIWRPPGERRDAS